MAAQEEQHERVVLADGLVAGAVRIDGQLASGRLERPRGLALPARSETPPGVPWPSTTALGTAPGTPPVKRTVFACPGSASAPPATSSPLSLNSLSSFNSNSPMVLIHSGDRFSSEAPSPP